MLTVATQHNWSSNVLDIRTVSFQGLPLDRDVCLKPPDDVQKSLGQLWKLKKWKHGSMAVKSLLAEKSFELVGSARFEYCTPRPCTCNILHSQVTYMCFKLS